MTIGRHRGLPMPEVPTDYLLWCAASMREVPQVVVEELKRRSQVYGSRDAVECASAVSSLLYRAARNQARFAGKPTKKQRRMQKRADRQRIAAKQTLDRIQQKPIVGENYTPASHDPASCPFDT